MDKNIEEVFKKIEKISRIEEKEKLNANENVFCILGMQDFEIRHSNFLAWLFDNDKKFLYGFLTCKELGIKEDRACILVDSKYNVSREYKKDMDGRSVDIVLSFPDDKLLIVIENKIYSTEGENQLDNYYNSFENSNEFQGYIRKYVYLTLNGDEPISNENKKRYICLSYSTVLQILEKVKTSGKLLNAKDYLINDYIQILKDKTVKVMNRVEEYFKIFDKHKDVVVDMASYIPDIKKRASIEKEIINKHPGLVLKSEKANAFVGFLNNEISDFSVKNNLPKDWIEFGFSNDPYSHMGFYVTILKDKDNKYVKFFKRFREHFNREDKSKDGNFITLFTTSLVISNKKNGFLKEQEFQDKIIYEIELLLNDKNSIYFRILNFTLNYEF